MYSTQPNGADSATINPAALASAELGNPNIRGIKRSRSPDFPTASHAGPGGDDDGQPNRKRGKPMKSLKPPSGISETPIPPPIPPGLHNVSPHTPQVQHAPAAASQQQPTYQTAPQASPPPKTAPVKSTLKALPTVRDHTTDQLGPGEDEYLPREFDDAGEKKVMGNGQLLGGREYRCRTFLVPNRGDKLFMLATECARVLGYRDSYLLFNKNRSLFKIIASQVEKDDLVGQEILPFSYRSRQIAIVTARSMFRQFGSRVIVNGRRVRDDYWETKARKQGFTEADLAGEKRPGASKAREAAAEANQNAAMLGGPHGEIVYSNTPGQLGGGPQPQFVQPDYNDTRSRDYSSILKTGPRQEITGPAYQDRSQPAPIGELHAQAHHAAEFNRTVNQQREMRGDYINSYWRRPHEQPAAAPISQPVGTTDTSVPSSRPAPSSHTAATGMPQPSLLSSQSPQMMMSAAPYSQPISSQNPIQPSMRSSSNSMPQPQGYNYPQSGQMWTQAPQTPQYSYTHPTQAQPSPHQQSSAAPQMRGTSSQVPGSSIPYSGMPGMSQGYPAQGQPMSYDQTPRQYMHQGAAGAPAVTQPWSGQQQPSSQWWTNQQQ